MLLVTNSGDIFFILILILIFLILLFVSKNQNKSTQAILYYLIKNALLHAFIDPYSKSVSIFIPIVKSDSFTRDKMNTLKDVFIVEMY